MDQLLVSDDGRECCGEVTDPVRYAMASDGDFREAVVISQFGFVPGGAVRDDAGAGIRVAAWLECVEGLLVVSNRLLNFAPSGRPM